MNLDVAIDRKRVDSPAKRCHPTITQRCSQGRQGTAIAIGLHQMHGPIAETRPHVVLLQAMPDRPTPHGRQLRGIPHQNQTTPRGKGRDQGLSERKIEHRHLVDHKQIQVERSINTPPESPGA